MVTVKKHTNSQDKTLKRQQKIQIFRNYETNRIMNHSENKIFKKTQQNKIN